MCSVHLLKIIGPCHTVSSFLNISSVIMSQWEQALGKVLVVFTYGSGCASSMYQLRFDEIPWMLPLASWKITFYRDAIYQHPSTNIHDVFCMTWMKFGFCPQGRKLFQIDPWKYQLDVYYLMEVDKWGRRFFHRGGIIAPALPSQFRLRVDKAEGRPKRDKYEVVKDKPAEKPKTIDAEWREIEYDMTFDKETDAHDEVVQEAFKTHNNDKKHVIVRRTEEYRHPYQFEFDGQPHKYLIGGTWSNFTQWDEMEDQEDGQWQYTVTIGENGWEEFFILQDGSGERLIYPAKDKAWKSQPCVGPWRAPKTGSVPGWRIETRDLDDTPEEDLAKPGDQFLITFSWRHGAVKNVEWDKLPDEHDPSYPVGKYTIAGTWTCWENVEMAMPNEGDGHHYTEVMLTWLGIQFTIQRNGNAKEVLMPEEVDVDEDGKPLAMVCSETTASVLGPDKFDKDKIVKWDIKGDLGDTYIIDFYRNPSDPSEMSVTWSKKSSGPVVEPEPRYFLVRPGEGWPHTGTTVEMYRIGMSNTFAADVEIYSKYDHFRIQYYKLPDKVIHPDKKAQEGVSQQQAHKVMGPDIADDDQFWTIGKASADKSRVGDWFQITYDLAEQKVGWKKK